MATGNPNRPYALDSFDLRILAVLQEEGDIDNRALARRVSLSPAPCLRRVRRLRQDGVIRQVVALLDAGQLGLGVEVFAFVTLETQRAAAGAQFEQLLRRRPEVVECVRLSGSYDYLLRVAVGSLDAYTAFLDRQLLAVPGVRGVNSSFSLGVLKRTTALPLPAARRTPHARRAPAQASKG